jgi:hypothetical protein
MNFFHRYSKEETQLHLVGFEVLTAVSTKMAVFWVALMMEAARSSETLVNFYQTTRRYNPEDSRLRNYIRLQPIVEKQKQDDSHSFGWRCWKQKAIRRTVFSRHRMNRS